MDYKEFEQMAREFCIAKRESRAADERLKEAGKKLDAFFEANMTNMGDMLKRKFSWSDLGTFTVKPETVVFAYGDHENKKKLFDFVLNKHGIESAWKLFPAHYGSLNSLYKEEALLAAEKGVEKLILPGCYEPETKLKYGFRKK